MMIELTFERILILLITLAFVLSIGIPLILWAFEAISELTNPALILLI